MIFILTFSIYGQDLSYKKPFWLNFNIGGGPEHFDFGVSYNKVLNDFSYQAGLSLSAEDFFSNQGMTTVNFNLGYSQVKNWMIAFANVGPSVSYGEARNKDHNNVNFWGAGLCFNTQVYFMPLYELFPGVGLGVELFYNFNIMLTEDVNYRNVYVIKIGACLTNLHMK